MTDLEEQIVSLMLMQPYMHVDNEFFIRLTSEARQKLFLGFHDDEYSHIVDLKPLLVGKNRWDVCVDQDKFDEITVWLTQQARSKYLLTDWLMLAFKSEADAALFKLFWL